MKNERQSSIHSQKYRQLIDILASARVKAGMSQSELAAKIGLKQPDISKIEAYERRLDILEALDIIHAIEPSEPQIADIWKAILDKYR